MFTRRNAASLGGLLVLELLLVFYLMVLNAKSSPFVELWPLNGILIETIITVSLMVVVTWFVFRSPTSTFLFVVIALLTLLITIPVIKYPNDKLLYGPWDSSAFYSFAKWVVENGYIASNNELYYSSQYGSHPGIALIPAIIQIVTELDQPLTFSMYLTLAVVYVVYIFFFLCTFKLLVIPSKLSKLSTYLLLISATMFFMNFPQYYGGGEIGYCYVGFILYVVFLMLTKQGERPISKLIALGLLSYTGLLIAHYSTAVIMASYFTILLVGSLLILERPLTRILAFISILVIIILFGYELYIDVYLSSSTIRGAFNTLARLYIRELELATRALEAHASLTFVDLLKYFLSQYIKQVMLLASIFIYLLVSLIKWKTFSKTLKLSTILFVLSLPTWIIGWAGVGNFMSGGRALVLIQFMFTLSIIYCSLNSKRLENKINPFSLIFVALFLIVIGFIFNYGISAVPLMQAKEGDVYTYPLGSEGAVTVWSLHPIEFANRSLTQSGPSFLCIQPYTGFGLCDLLWDKPKIPIHGFISPQLTVSEEVLKLIDSYTNVVVPIPSSDRVLPGPIGYKSYYLIPYYYCLNRCEGKIYTNGLYHLFIR